MDDIDIFDSKEDSKKPQKGRFVPCKFKPKPTHQESKPSVAANGVAKAEPVPPIDAMDIVEEKEKAAGEHAKSEIGAEVKVDAETEATDSPMVGDDDGEDRVVREIDVFFNPSTPEDKANFYIFQYPIRPRWRPYELDERCEEVRVKPDSGQVEIDISLEVDSENYDAGKGNTTNQTLASLWGPHETTSCAIGFLRGDKLHLNPIHRVVQLRPSMHHIKGNGSNNKSKGIGDMETSIKSEAHDGDVNLLPKKQSKLNEVSNQSNTDDEQDWISLNYHGPDDELSSRYLQNMVAKESSPIQFSMSPYNYMNSLFPRSSEVGVIDRLKRLLPLPLEERFKTWLSDVCRLGDQPMLRFNGLKHLAPNDTVEDVLKVLTKYARLVQGIWVPNSSLFYGEVQGLHRDYALMLFSKSPTIKSSDIKNVPKPFNAASLNIAVGKLATNRKLLNHWKFKEPTDVSFINQFPDIVREQKNLWEETEKQWKSICHGNGRSGLVAKSSSKASVPYKPEASMKLDASGPSATETTSRGMTMSNETRAALPKALKMLFQTHEVCSFQQIRQGLQDMAVSLKNSPKADARAVVLAAHALEAPEEELRTVISQVAISVHGNYVLKSSTENPDYDSFRKVVIDLFSASKPGARLKKSELAEAARITLKREIPTNEYNKVMHELCVNRSNSWVLKSGDGNPR